MPLKSENIQEILTYDAFITKGNLYLSVPVSGLINPQYLIKNNSLYIFLYNYTQAFVIHNLSPYDLNYIKEGKAYLKASLSYDNVEKHSINLIPF